MLENLIVHDLDENYPRTVRLTNIKVLDRGEVRKMGAGTVTLRVGDRVMLDVNGELTYGVVYTEPYPMPFTPPMRIMT